MVSFCRGTLYGSVQDVHRSAERVNQNETLAGGGYCPATRVRHRSFSSIGGDVRRTVGLGHPQVGKREIVTGWKMGLHGGGAKPRVVADGSGFQVSRDASRSY